MTLDLAALKREARKEGTPPERLLELAEMGPELAGEILRSINTPPEVLERLAVLYSEDEKILEKVAAHVNTPVPTLTMLAQKVPWSVAWNRATPTALLRQLAKHPNSSVRDRVEFNPSTPSDIKQALARVRESLPLSLKPREILELYSKGKKYFDDFLLRNIEPSDIIPAEAALALAQHPNPEIRQALLQHSDKVAEAVRSQIVQQLQGETP
ncbi:hypothetical protein ACFP81_13825 [Deinococcus lacus]|uniref:Leucine rich repeat variant n=1 Tax=Deinococcus lacus TaxID=392561 RepID=A0ABW1YF14_9DEIO